MDNVFKQIQNKFFADATDWFVEEEGYKISFGSKSSNWFTLHEMSSHYYLLYAYRLSCPAELTKNVALCFEDYFKDKQRDVLISSITLIATGPNALKSKEICDALNNGLRGESWSTCLPLYSWAPAFIPEAQVIISCEQNEGFATLKSTEEAVEFVRQQREDKKQMEEAKMWIHSWIKTTCPDIQFHQNATIDWDFLYYFYDGPAIQYTFQKKIKNKQAVYVGSYSFDGVKTSYESIDLTKIIEQTKEKIKTDISSMTKKSNSV